MNWWCTSSEVTSQGPRKFKEHYSNEELLVRTSCEHSGTELQIFYWGNVLLSERSHGVGTRFVICGCKSR